MISAQTLCVCREGKPVSTFPDHALERFPAKWTPVRVKKTRQNKKLEPCSDSIGTEKALVLLFEIGNDIGAILRALHLIEHLRAWHERSGIGQPTVQCRLVPG